MNKEIVMAVLLGVGLSASCGFRVFVPMLVTALATHFGWFPGWVHNQFPWMGTMPAIIALGSASVIEIAAYYIPVVDHALDTIATPLAVVAGTLLTSAVLPVDDEMLRWGMGLIVGGGSAGVVQSGTVITRMLSGKFTMTAGNGVVASGENIASISGSIMAFVLPIITGIVALVMVWVMGGWLISRFRKSAV